MDLVSSNAKGTHAVLNLVSCGLSDCVDGDDDVFMIIISWHGGAFLSLLGTSTRTTFLSGCQS